MFIKNCLWCGSKNLIQKAKRKDNIPILRCQECNLMMVGEMPDDLSDLYKKDYFEKDNGNESIGYENYLSSPSTNLLGKYAFVRLFIGENFKRHLDVGCADGSLVELFKNYKYDSSGLDISGDAVREGKSKDLDVNESDLKTICFGNGEFDFVTGFDIIEHLDSPKKTLHEIKRVLKDDGIFIYSTLGIDSVSDKEFWFNNSLEHLIYYDEKVLTGLMEEVFGKNNVLNVKVEINGVSEIIGIAKKDKISSYEKKVFDIISSGGATMENKKDNYFLSLFYNQLGKFEESQKTIDLSSFYIGSEEFIFLSFMRLFYQGQFSKAADLINNADRTMSLSNNIFWQTYSFVLDKLLEINNNKNSLHGKDEIIKEKDLLIQKKDDALYDLYHSRIIKPAIIFRDKLRVYNHHLKGVRAYFELSLIKLAKKYLSKEIRLWISQFLPKKYRIVLKKVKNRKWDGPLISIVTPYYNHGRTINETVESVLNQTFKNFEYIIVNDGSSDKDSNDVFAKIENSKITKIVQENGGVAKARNNGIELAKGKYILCLDSDDKIDPTYLEKALIVLESNPGIDIVYSDMYFFGLEEGVYVEPEFDPRVLYKSNIITTAAVFRRKAWERVGGYKSEIGFEDWEFWINLVENGSVAKRIPEALFLYRRASISRYIEDKKKQDLNVSKIQKMHKNYYKKIRSLVNFKYLFENESQFINLTNEGGSNSQNYNKNVLLLMPWLTFGGAETLVFNYTNEIKDKFNFSIITGLKSDNAWNYKFREVTSHITHLPNILNEDDYLNYVCNYIKNYNIDIIHIVHNSFSYFWLDEIKRRFPGIKVISTVFNTLADHFGNSLENSSYIDQFISDNTLVVREYKKNNIECRVIHNGIDCVNKFNSSKYDRLGKRKELGIKEDEKAVYFIGRLSPEKNPDVFLESAKEIVKKHSKIKFFIIGDGPMRAALKKSISEFGHKNIMYLGYQTDIPQYLSTADIFVLPSKIEGFPLSNIEAMSMGVCVISSDVGGVRDAIIDGENGFLVEPNSSSALTDKINFIVNNEHLLEDVSKNARKTIEEGFSIEILASNYNDLYKNV